MTNADAEVKAHIFFWKPGPGPGWTVGFYTSSVYLHCTAVPPRCWLGVWWWTVFGAATAPHCSCALTHIVCDVSLAFEVV